MLNRVISQHTFGVVKVGDVGIGNAKLAVRLSQFPVGATKEDFTLASQLFGALLAAVQASQNAFFLVACHHLDFLEATLTDVQLLTFAIDLFLQKLKLFLKPIKLSASSIQPLKDFETPSSYNFWP